MSDCTSSPLSFNEWVRFKDQCGNYGIVCHSAVFVGQLIRDNYKGYPQETVDDSVRKIFLGMVLEYHLRKSKLRQLFKVKKNGNS